MLPPGSSPPAWRVPSQEEIAAIISDAANLSLRNLRITVCYGEISRALGSRLGEDNVNWCTFATWASRTAGRFIRLERIDDHVREALGKAFGSVRWTTKLEGRLKTMSGVLRLDDDLVIDAATDLATSVSAEIAAGNLTVFAELAPLFSSIIDAMDREQHGEREPMDRVIESLVPGPTAGGGQDLLRQAVADYRLVRFERDPRRKAELVLRANAQVGAHEQIRLQDYIRRGMTAPLPEAVAVRLQRKIRAASSGSETRGLKTLVNALLEPYRRAFERMWLRVATRYLMTLELPNGTLHLGRDLPNLPGQPIFPPHLTGLQDDALLNLLRRYRAAGANAEGSGAIEWSSLPQRMRYILQLFRSRQQDAKLFQPPFDPLTRDAIQRGDVSLSGL